MNAGSNLARYAVLAVCAFLCQTPDWRCCANAQSMFPISTTPAVPPLISIANAQQHEPSLLQQCQAVEWSSDQSTPNWLSDGHLQPAGEAPNGTEKETGKSDGNLTAVDGSADRASTSCASCGCSSCQCQLDNAPCVECPHATTLNPYYNINFFGALKFDMLFNTARPVSPGVPFFLAPDSLTGLDQNTVDIHARQTTLGAALIGPKMGDFQSGGTVIVMLFNDNVIADRYGFLPLQAYGELKNDDWRMAAGLQFDVFAPGLPTVLPFSALAASGNAGNSFRGQLRLERFVHVSHDAQWTLQSALSEPISTTIDPTFGVSEDNGWPNVEGRIALGLGDVEGTGLAAKRPFEVGLSGVVGQIRTTPLPPGNRVVSDVWGVALDSRWNMTANFGVAGEVYTGETLGTYNGAILQEINADTLAGLRSTGGWMETFYYWTPCLHSHVGYGLDDPVDNDVADSAAALGRTFNSTVYSNLLWDVNQSFRIGFEFAWRETDYKTAANPDNEGAGFHTQLQWAF